MRNRINWEQVGACAMILVFLALALFGGGQ